MTVWSLPWTVCLSKTGNSSVAAIDMLKKAGATKLSRFLLSALAAPKGVAQHEKRPIPMYRSVTAVCR